MSYFTEVRLDPDGTLTERPLFLLPLHLKSWLPAELAGRSVTQINLAVGGYVMVAETPDAVEDFWLLL